MCLTSGLNCNILRISRFNRGVSTADIEMQTQTGGTLVGSTSSAPSSSSTAIAAAVVGFIAILLELLVNWWQFTDLLSIQ